jgi:hypothetical protein
MVPARRNIRTRRQAVDLGRPARRQEGRRQHTGQPGRRNDPGKRNEERSTNERGYYHSERIYGSFHRTIPLPEGAHVDAAKASFKDGVLSIEVPVPQQSARGRTLEIKDGSSSRSGSTGHS